VRYYEHACASQLCSQTSTEITSRLTLNWR